MEKKPQGVRKETRESSYFLEDRVKYLRNENEKSRKDVAKFENVVKIEKMKKFEKLRNNPQLASHNQIQLVCFIDRSTQTLELKLLKQSKLT